MFTRPFRELAAYSPRTLLFTLLVVFPLTFIGCPRTPNRTGNANSSNPPTSTSSPERLASSFDGERAFEHVRRQVEFGPRPAGSAELERTRAYIIDQLKSYGLTITTDEFHPVTPIGDKRIVNVTAELPGESSEVIIISSHYDTKLFKQFNFVGADDAGSSTGALMEIARVLASNGRKPRLTYWFVFFDGEEAFCENWDQCKNPNPSDPKSKLPDNTYGSRRYIAQLEERNQLRRVRAMILLDMVGYKDLRFGRDDMSTPWLVDIVWRTARELGYGAEFVDQHEGVGGDDHEPFLRAGIDSLDIIQLNSYPYWHTKEDTLDKVSAKSLKIVGDVVLASLSQIEERLTRKGSR
jgi:Zn-dependent M28 family amino/carboxypeptidase